MVVVHMISAYAKEWYAQRSLIAVLSKKYDLHIVNLEILKTYTQHPGPDVIILAQKSDKTNKYINKFPNAVIIYIDHGVSFLKDFIKNEFTPTSMRYVSANSMLLRLRQSIRGIKRSDHVCGSYPRFLDHNKVSFKHEFMNKHELKGNLVLFAPTWISDLTIYSEQKRTIAHLSNVKNGDCIVIQHTDARKHNNHKNVKVLRNNGSNIIDAIKHADVVISDTSSILFEAAAHGKRIVQVLYSNNSGENYGLPIVPIINQPFYIGKLTRPERVAEAVDEILENPKMYDEEFMPVIKTIGDMSGTKDNTILKAIDDMIALKKEDITEEKCELLTPEEYRKMLGYDKMIRKKEGKVGIAFTHDINVLKVAREQCDTLIVGVPSNQKIEADHVFIDRSLAYRRHYIHKYQADILFAADGESQNYSDICEVKIIPRSNVLAVNERIEYYAKCILNPIQLEFMHQRYYEKNYANEDFRAIRDRYRFVKFYCHQLDQLIPDDIGVFYALGDVHFEMSHPCLSKSRPIDGKNNVILPLNYNRHWEHVKPVYNSDIKFSEKDDKIIWRGCSTGYWFSDRGRKAIVMRWANTKNQLIDVGLTGYVQNVEDRASYLKPTISIENQLKSKFLVSVEGNDVASGLKWMLASNSCVLMTKPKMETWAMEGKLEPWIHYVPLKPDYSDLETQHAWCLKNLDKCEEIAQNGRKFIADNFFDEDKEQEIIRGIIQLWKENVTIVAPSKYQIGEKIVNVIRK